jgi:hypothetical protein
LSEAIRITPQQIITRNLSGQITFNTDNLYIKTDPNGVLFAGGNTRSPMIYGQNTIGDDQSSGFFAGTSFFASDFFPTGFSRTIQYWIPNISSQPRIVFSSNWNQNGSVFQTPDWRPVVYYDANTAQRSNTQAIYKWAVAYGNNGLHSIWPIIFNLPTGPLNPAGGIFELAYSANEHSNYTIQTTDGYGNVITYRYQDLYGFPQMYSRPHSMYTSRNPIQLSLNITP